MQNKIRAHFTTQWKIWAWNVTNNYLVKYIYIYIILFFSKKQGVTAHYNLGVVDYKALIGLSPLQVPHFRIRHGASLKVIHPDTTSASITKCSLVSQWNMMKHTNISKSLELRIERVIYWVRQITHREITKNKRDQVIVTMHTSKLKMNTRTKHIRTRTQRL
jgi:hypothetical protein